MMRLTRRAVLLPVAVYLLTSAETAHAECAWVLWNDEARLDHGTNTESRFWHPIAGVSRKPDCEARLRRQIEQVTSGAGPQQERGADAHEDDVRAPGRDQRRQQVRPCKRQRDVVYDQVASHDRDRQADPKEPLPPR